MKKLLALALLTGLTGCQMTNTNMIADVLPDDALPVSVELGKAALEMQLKDPDSVKYGKTVRYMDTSNEPNYCISYNAKNSYGGYTGYSWAFIASDGSLLQGSSVYQTICNNAYMSAIKTK